MASIFQSDDSKKGADRNDGTTTQGASTQSAENGNERPNESTGEDFISKKLRALSQKSAQELTVFDLTFLFGTRFSLCRIHGILHTYNGKFYYPLDRQALEAKILEVLFDKLDERGDIRIIGSIVFILERLPLIDYEEASEWLGFANGVLNIQNWRFYEHSQLQIRWGLPNNTNFPQPVRSPQTPPDPPIITYNLCVSFDYTWTSFHMPTPSADKFFNEITGSDPTLTARIYEMIGYLLVPDTTAKTFFLLQGVPDSGKSILGRFLEGFFPPQCVTALDISRLGGQFLPESLSTSRLNLSMDLPDGVLSKKAVAMIKMLTGNDLITHEVKYKDAKPFRGQCKFLFSINGKLKMTGRDTAFLDRIVCIPFRYPVPKMQRNKNLLSNLNQEREAIMMKALSYYQAFVERNRIFSGGNNYLPDVEYRLSLNDTIIEFVSEACILCKGAYTSTEDLYASYLSFCDENKLKAVPSKSGFGQRLSSLYVAQITPHRNHRSKDDNLRGYDGIRIISDYYVMRQRSFDQSDEYDDSDDDQE